MDGPEKIRIQKLPEVVHKMVFDELEIIDLFTLSLLSRKMKKIVSDFKFKIPQILWYFGPHCCFLEISKKREFYNDGQYSLQFILDSKNLNFPQNSFKINGKSEIPLNFQRRDLNMIYVKSDKNQLAEIQILEDLTKELREIFKVEEFNFHSKERNFENFDFLQNIPLRLHTVTLSKIHISIDIAKFLLENFNLDFFNLENSMVHAPNGPQNLNVNCRKLKFENPNFLTFDSILANPKVQELESDHIFQKLEIQDFCIFIKLWIDGVREKPNFTIRLDFENQRERNRKRFRKGVMDKLRELGIVRATKEQLSSGTLFRIYRTDGKSASLQIGRYFYFNANEEEEEDDSEDSEDSDDDEDIVKIDLKKSYKDGRGDNFGDLTEEEDVSSDSSGW
ncbi:unnamed protein product [Caenorhabditis nigoni]